MLLMPYHNLKLFGNDVPLLTQIIAMHSEWIDANGSDGPWAKTKPMWKRWVAANAL